MSGINCWQKIRVQRRGDALILEVNIYLINKTIINNIFRAKWGTNNGWSEHCWMHQNNWWNARIASEGDKDENGNFIINDMKNNNNTLFRITKGNWLNYATSCALSLLQLAVTIFHPTHPHLLHQAEICWLNLLPGNKMPNNISFVPPRLHRPKWTFCHRRLLHWPQRTLHRANKPQCWTAHQLELAVKRHLAFLQLEAAITVRDYLWALAVLISRTQFKVISHHQQWTIPPVQIHHLPFRKGIFRFCLPKIIYWLI